MKLEKNSLIAILLSISFYFMYETYMNSKYPDRFKTKTVQQEAFQQNAAGNDGSSGIPQSQSESKDSSPFKNSSEQQTSANGEHYALMSQSDLTLETNQATYLFDQQTGGLKHMVLKHFFNDTKEPLSIDNIAIFASTKQSVQPSVKKALKEGNRISFTHKEGPFEITQTTTLDPDTYGLTFDFEWTNVSAEPQVLTSWIVLQNEMPLELGKAPSLWFVPGIPVIKPSISLSKNHKSEWIHLDEPCKDSFPTAYKEESLQEIDFIGFDRHYFTNTFLPVSKKQNYNIYAKKTDAKKCLISLGLSLDQGSVSPSGKISQRFQAWFGPKDLDLMSSYDSQLEKAVDLGFFHAISLILLKALKYIYSVLGNWGFSIILLTFLLKLLFYPLTRQAAVSMNKLKQLQPQMNKIKERFKDDQRLQQQELMKFMGQHKINPMKGCLPILPQIPVFFAFYRALSTSIDLRHASFAGWISDLSVADPYYITPILLGGTMFLQQKLTPTTGMDKTQEKVMLMIPLIFSVSMLTLPAGMTLYMLTNTVISIVQQQWLNKQFKPKAA